MKAAETRASMATADWTPLTVVSRSRTTAEIETFINDVSMTKTNIAIASRMPSRGVPDSDAIASDGSRPRLRRCGARIGLRRGRACPALRQIARDLGDGGC